MNEIIIEGRLAQNPEKKQAKTGTTMTTFNVASDRMMDKGNIDYSRLFSSVSLRVQIALPLRAL